MEPLTWHSRPAVTDPVVIGAFEGWNDAAGAASGAVEWLIDRSDTRLVFSIDHDEFNDHQVSRPQVVVTDEGTRDITWPATRLFGTSIDGHDLLLLLGEEPRLRWRSFVDLIGKALRELGVHRVLTLGAFIGQVPHTLPVPIIGVLPDAGTRAALGLLPSSYEGPTGIVGVLNHYLGLEGFDASSLWAAVPHYLAGSSNPKASQALLAKATGLLAIDLGPERLDGEVSDWEQRVKRAVEDSDELRDYLAELEQSTDQWTEGNEGRLVEEIERFLRGEA